GHLSPARRSQPVRPTRDGDWPDGERFAAASFLVRPRLLDRLLVTLVLLGPTALGAAEPTVAAVAYHRKTGHVVLIQKQEDGGAGKWVFPGGRVKTGKQAERVARERLLRRAGI